MVLQMFLVAAFAMLIQDVRCQCTASNTFEESCYIIPHAERYCNALKGDLASIESAEEHSFIANLIKTNYSGPSLTFQTANHYQYRFLEDEGVSIHGHTSVSFMVQACNDAHLGLSRTKDSTHDTYEIVIGGWSDSQSVMRDCMQCAHMDEVRQQDHPVDCQQQRPFWLSWEDGHVRLGAGETVGEGGMLDWQDPTPHAVNHLGISTGFGSSGVWNFTVNSYQPGVFWLGLTDLQVEGEWNRLPDLEEMEWSRWAPGQPSGARGRHCAAMDGARGLDWIDADCEFHRNFVCEMRKFGE